MYEIKFSKKVVKFYDKCDDKFKEKIVNCFEEISVNPLSKRLDIKYLKGMKNHYRLRIGKYRLLYEIQKNENIVLCYDADSRGNIYKK